MINLKPQYLIYAIILSGVLTINPAFSQNRPDKAASGNLVTLVYHFPADREIHYLNTGKVAQKMEINGQTMPVDVLSILACSIKSEGREGKNLKLGIKVDSISQIIDSPQGKTGGALQDASGKTFNMIISPVGKEIDLSEAKKIIVNVEGSGPTDLSQSFVGFFPVLPEGPVKPGYTWQSSDTINSKTASNSIFMVVNSQNKFEGFEKYHDVDCARITSVLEGTRVMNILSQGTELKTSGSFTGTGIVYFSPQEGYFISQTVTTRMTGQLEIVSPESMSLPLTMDVTSVNEVQK